MGSEVGWDNCLHVPSTGEVPFSHYSVAEVCILPGTQSPLRYAVIGLVIGPILTQVRLGTGPLPTQKFTNSRVATILLSTIDNNGAKLSVLKVYPYVQTAN